MQPLVSIICKTYNHAPYIRDALDGFVMQKTNFPFEVVLHDDASLDGTQDIIREYERNYPKIFKVIYQKENQYSKGVKVNKKYLLPKIRGKYMAVCEGDDYWFDPNKLQLQVDYMEKNPNCVCTFHPTIWLTAQNSKVKKVNQQWSEQMDLDGDYMIMPGASYVNTLSIVLKADIWKKFPKFRQIADVGDYPIIYLLATEGYFHYFTNVMGVYRTSSVGSWTEKYLNNPVFAANHHLTALKWLYEFHLYSKGKFAVSVGKQMCTYILKLDEKSWNLVFDYSKFEEIVEKTAVFNYNMSEAEKLALEVGDESLKSDLKKSEFDYWTGFVETIGQVVNES